MAVRNHARSTEIARKAGFPTVNTRLQRDDTGEYNILSIAGRDADEVRRYAEFLAKHPGAEIVKQPYISPDGISRAKVRIA